MTMRVPLIRDSAIGSVTHHVGPMSCSLEILARPDNLGYGTSRRIPNWGTRTNWRLPLRTCEMPWLATPIRPPGRQN